MSGLRRRAGIGPAVALGLKGMTGGVIGRPDFEVQLTTSIIPARGTGPATFTRATPRTVADHEGKLNTLLSGEVGFQGARRVRNLLSQTESFGGNWNPAAAGIGTLPTKTVNYGGVAAPDGSFTACRVQCALNGSVSSTDQSYISEGTNAPAVADLCQLTCWFRTTDGTTKTILTRIPNAQAAYLVTITGTWRRYAIQMAGSGGANTFSPGLRGSVGTSDSADFLMWHPQLEVVTGQFNQNPGEYVSVGVLAAPFHGTNVDGVKCFDTYNGNTVTSTVVTAGVGLGVGQNKNQLAWLFGTANNFFSTPDAAANRITTGTLRVEGRVLPASSADATQRDIAAKWNTVNKRSWRFNMNGNSLLFGASADGLDANVVSVTSSTTFTAVLYQEMNVAVDYVIATGACTFYTSLDGATWTQLGTVRNTGLTALFDGTGSSMYIGGRDTSVTWNGGLGKVCMFRNGVRFACFDPNDWNSGTTFTSSATGEVWTLAGTVSIANTPLRGYLPEQASTNLALWSSDFSNVAWTKASTTVGGSTLLPTGIVGTVNKLQEDNTLNVHGINQVLISPSTGYVMSVWGKAAEQTTLILANDSTGTAIFNLAAGTVGSVSVGTAAMVPYPNGWYRCIWFFTSGAGASTSLSFRMNINSAYTGTTGFGLYLWGAQLEQTTIVSSLIPTTTVAVTRNQDQLTYPSSGNAATAAGTMYAEITYADTTAYNHYTLTVSDATLNNRATIFNTSPSAAASMAYRVTSGGVAQLSNAGTLTPSATVNKQALRWSSADATAYLNAAQDRQITGALTPPAAFTTIGIGLAEGGSGSQPNSPIRNVRIWKVALNDADMKIITS